MGLDTCSHNHAEVCYDSYGTRGCPICELIDEKGVAYEELEETIVSMGANIDTQEIELIELRDELVRLTDKLEELYKRYPQADI